jgi:hypothetical protein
MTVYKGWRANLYKKDNGSYYEIGYCEDVTVEVNQSLLEYYTVTSHIVQELVEGPIKITGSFKKAWVDINYLSLIFSSTELNDFDLKVNIGNAITLYIYDCKFAKGELSIPQDGIMKESYDFTATRIGVV